MKKLLGIIILVLLWFEPVNATEKFIAHEKVNWEGKCFIQYEGKVVVDNEMCKMELSEYGEERDEFSIIVSKEVDCDDGTKNCSYFFYANQEKLFKNTYLLCLLQCMERHDSCRTAN